MLNVEVGMSVLLVLNWSLSGGILWKWLATRPSECLGCSLRRDLFSDMTQLVTSYVTSSA